MSLTQRVSGRNTKIAFKVKDQMSPKVIFLELTTVQYSYQITSIFSQYFLSFGADRHNKTVAASFSHLSYHHRNSRKRTGKY